MRKNSKSRTWIYAALAIGTWVGLSGTATAAGPRAGEKVRVYEVPDIPPVPPMPSLRALRSLQNLSLPRLAPRGWFGVGLSCNNCNISVEDSTGAARWKFPSAPTIYSVDPDSPASKAGIEPGDKLTHIDGVSITSTDGGRRFGAVGPGDKVEWTLVHQGKKRVVSMVAEEHPDRDEFDPDVNQRIAEALDRVRSERDRMQLELERLGNDHDLAESDRLNENARALEATQKALERMTETLERRSESLPRRWPAPRVLAIPSLPDMPDEPLDPPRHLRYQGSVSGAEVEVRGSGSVVVSEEHGGDELLITTPDATIRIQKRK